MKVLLCKILFMYYYMQLVKMSYFFCDSNAVLCVIFTTNVCKIQYIYCDNAAFYE